MIETTNQRGPHCDIYIMSIHFFISLSITIC